MSRSVKARTRRIPQAAWDRLRAQLETHRAAAAAPVKSDHQARLDPLEETEGQVHLDAQVIQDLQEGTVCSFPLRHRNLRAKNALQDPLDRQALLALRACRDRKVTRGRQEETGHLDCLDPQALKDHKVHLEQLVTRDHLESQEK